MTSPTDNDAEKIAACTICDGTERLQEGHGKGGLNDVCLPCFYIWYDGCPPCEREECRDRTPHLHGEDIREISLKAKAEGKWPWNEQSAPRLLQKDQTHD